MTVDLGLQVPLFEMLLKMQTNSMKVYREQIFQDFQYRYLNYKQIR